MSIIFLLSDFKKLENLYLDGLFSSQIDFQIQDWYFTQLMNEEMDVEIRYLFHFDRLDSNTIEVFCNGLFDDEIHYILSLLKSSIPKLHYRLY